MSESNSGRPEQAPPAIKDIFDLIDQTQPTLGPGPHTAVEDENGVVHIQDRNGAIRASMTKQDYEEILKYKADP